MSQRQTLTMFSVLTVRRERKHPMEKFLEDAESSLNPLQICPDMAAMAARYDTPPPETPPPKEKKPKRQSIYANQNGGLANPKKGKRKRWGDPGGQF